MTKKFYSLIIHCFYPLRHLNRQRKKVQVLFSLNLRLQTPNSFFRKMDSGSFVSRQDIGQCTFHMKYIDFHLSLWGSPTQWHVSGNERGGRHDSKPIGSLQIFKLDKRIFIVSVPVEANDNGRRTVSLNS